MNRRPFLVALLGVALASCALPGPAAPARPRWRLVVHGGAGISRAQLSPEREARLRSDLERALLAGREVLAKGGASLDAVTATITVLEDSPLFNAGRGAVFNHEGKNELDAAIMDGFTRQAGSVAGVTRVKNPILAARRVMERSGHVMLIGAGADQFAGVQGLELVEPSYYFTEERWAALQQALAREHDAVAVDGGHTSVSGPEEHFGTVGAVALDAQGHLAAGTSTGGMTNKRFGRVGDSPIIGAGTWASASCAVSATGHGEHFIRHAVAHEICARVEHLRWPVARAANHLVNDELVRAGAEGGVIALDAEGGWATPFNTQGMVRGEVANDGPTWTAIFSE